MKKQGLTQFMSRLTHPNEDKLEEVRCFNYL